MTSLKNKIAVVTGGSRGIGRGIVNALAAEEASVWAIARKSDGLEALEQEIKGVQTIAADVSLPQTASQTVREIRPNILVLNAGATPTMAPVHKQSWEQFSRVWDVDVKATFHFGKEALLAPLPSGSVVVILSSGAAIGGSPLSGGYSGAKRTQWFLAKFLQGESNALGLGIRFVALLPNQIIGTTELGHTASSAYAAQQGISKEKFLERFNAPLTPEAIGRGVIKLITDVTFQQGIAFTISGQGLELLE